MGRRWNRNHSPHNHWRGIRMEPYRGPAGGCRRKRPLGFLSDGLGPKAVSKSCPKYGGIESIPVDSRGPDPAPNWGMFQKNPAMTPVCPISVPVLRIRRSGVRLPPGAQFQLGPFRTTQWLPGLGGTSPSALTRLRLTWYQIRHQNARDLKPPAGVIRAPAPSVRRARRSRFACCPPRGDRTSRL